MFAHSKVERGFVRLDIENVGGKKTVEIKRDNDIFNRYTSLARKGVRVNSVPNLHKESLTMNIDNTGERRYRRAKPIFDEKVDKISNKKHLEPFLPKTYPKGKRTYPHNSTTPYALYDDTSAKQSKRRPNSVIERKTNDILRHDSHIVLDHNTEKGIKEDVKENDYDDYNDNDDQNQCDHMMTINMTIGEDNINDSNRAKMTISNNCKKDKLSDYDINEKSKLIHLQNVKMKLEKRIKMTHHAAMSLIKSSSNKTDDCARIMETSQSKIIAFENRPRKRLPKQLNKSLNKEADTLSNKELKKYYRINDEFIQKKQAAMNNPDFNNKCFKEMIELCPYGKQNQSKKIENNTKTQHKKPLFKL